MNEPLVSICCVTYNHESYIRAAIEGFLIQKTTFPFEIIIHDDASVDGTADIINDFAKKHKDQIIPILQKKNRYSQGISPSPTYVWPRARGKYIALCEGDDYWTDPDKLQIQVDALEKNGHCDISFHPVIKKFDDNSKPDEIMARHYNENLIVPSRNIILGEAVYCPTASLVFRKSILGYFISENPKIGGSFFIKVFGSLRGGAFYINKPMGVYRKMSAGSWSERERTNPDFFISHHTHFLGMLKQANNITEKKFDTEFNYLFQKRYETVLASRKAPAHLKRDFFKNNKDDINLKTRLKWIFIYRFGLIHRIYGIIKFLFK